MAAYTRDFVDVEEVLGVYSASKNLQDEILISEDPKNIDYAYNHTDPDTQREIYVNPYFAASCHARYIDEALTEPDENCRFAMEDRRIVVLATKPMAPGTLLQIRYGSDYWLKRIKHNPIELSQIMFSKYESTMKEAERKEWRRALKRKESNTNEWTSPKKATNSQVGNKVNTRRAADSEQVYKYNISLYVFKHYDDF